MKRIGTINVDIESGAASLKGFSKFFYGDNNQINIVLDNVNETIGDVCYFASNQRGQMVCGNAVKNENYENEYVIDAENMDSILNVVGNVEVQVQVFDNSDDRNRLTATNTITLVSEQNYDRKKTEVLAPTTAVNLSYLLWLAQGIADGTIVISGGGGTGQDGATFIPYVSPAGIISWTNNGDLPNPQPVNIMGPEGAKGDTGASIVDVTKNASNHIIITLDNGVIFDVGEIPTVAGEDGEDGISPVIRETATATGYTIVMTDAEGTHTITLHNGQDGQDGATGPAGPAGPKGDTGSQGPQGVAGEDGISPVLTETTTINGYDITITDKNGTRTIHLFNGNDGAQGPAGQPGSNGVDGTTFTPSVSAEGVISWTNDGNKQNPASVNIKGPAGQNGTNGQDGYTPVRGTDYWTTSDIAAMEAYCDNYIDTVILGGTS